ncbi:uncharacterized protein LOC116601182 isoform X2 [Nematostella vectensis]|uniref:uncharacterized protein LOC116601182 isoform X2 n=1 Tax=Nematostella vectensis TaxID=45351 RepID=UPI00138FF57F|nr:uncharacterized protein LOC116601182 isoform X2 [Nematostella vectensis]
MVDIQQPDGSYGSSEDSTLPMSPHHSDYDTSSMGSSRRSPRSISPASCLLNDSLEYLQHAWTGQDTFDLFRPVSGNNSRQSTPRTSGMPSPGMARMLREMASDSDRVCSPDASTLYTNRTEHYNPSGFGQHAHDECMEYGKWANCFLQFSPHGAHITDLTRDLADGLTLIDLVETLIGVSVEPIHVKPALEVQRTENIQACLDVLTWNGVNVDNIPTEDIVKENTKVVLAFCKIMRNHFGSSPATPVVIKPSPRRTPPWQEQLLPPRGPLSPLQTLCPSPLSPRSTRSHFAGLAAEDCALLNWVGNVTRTKVKGYESFQDGHILCLLLNHLTAEEAIPAVVLEHGLPSEKVSLALEVIRDELNIEADVSTDEVLETSNPGALAEVLRFLHQFYILKLKSTQEDLDSLTSNGTLKRASQKSDEFGITTQESQQKREYNERSSKPNNREKIFHESNNGREEDFKSINRKGLGVLSQDPRNAGPKYSSYFTSFQDRHSREGLPPSETSFEGNPPKNERRSLPKLPERKLESKSSSSSFTDNFISLKKEVNDFHDEEESAWLLEFKNSKNRRSIEQDIELFSDLKAELAGFEKEIKVSTNRKLVSKQVPKLNFDFLVPSESLFDIESPRTHFTGVSYKDKCDSAKAKLADYDRQLELLKKQYFDVMQQEYRPEPSDDGIQKRNSFPGVSSPLFAREYVKADNQHEESRLSSNLKDKGKSKASRRIKSLSAGGIPNQLLQSYSNVQKGTFPPYRTWSIHISEKVRNTSVKSRGNDKKAPSISTRTESEKEKSSIGKIAPRNYIESERTMKEKFVDDASGYRNELTGSIGKARRESVDSLNSTVRGTAKDETDPLNSSSRLLGLTALIRMTAKKASAVSDTE